MEVYCVSEFSIGPRGNVRYTPVMRYLGTDRELAVRSASAIAPAVMGKPEGQYQQLYCALPTTVEREVIRYHNNKDVWASVVQFELKENE